MATDIFEDENFTITRFARGKDKGSAYQFNLDSCYIRRSKKRLIKSLEGALKALKEE